MDRLVKERELLEKALNGLYDLEFKTESDLQDIKDIVRELKRINKDLKKKQDLFERYELGTQVEFENMYDDIVRRGVVTKHDEKFPMLLEVTCDSDRVWFVSVDMVKAVK